MASATLPKLLLTLFFAFLFSSSANGQGLKVGFYRETCRNAEAIVLKEMTRIISVAPSLAGPLLRMHFHDCFVRGCDASVLLNSTTNNQAEKDAPPNLTLRGFSAIDRIKAKLETACKGVVSCADIIALVARDAVTLTGGPFWRVPTGRRDGKVSRALDTLGNLLPGSANISSLKTVFSQKGLNDKDLVVLSGGHTIGTSHCSSFSNRLYNFTGKNDTDPTLDQRYIAALKKKCKPNDSITLVEMDPGSSKKFDLGYFNLVTKHRGLFESDAALLQDAQTSAYVQRHANGFTTEFFKDFGESMVKMGKIGVLTGKQGEIRKKCAFVN